MAQVGHEIQGSVGVLYFACDQTQIRPNQFSSARVQLHVASRWAVTTPAAAYKTYLLEKVQRQWAAEEHEVTLPLLVLLITRVTQEEMVGNWAIPLLDLGLPNRLTVWDDGFADETHSRVREGVARLPLSFVTDEALQFYNTTKSQLNTTVARLRAAVWL